MLLRRLTFTFAILIWCFIGWRFALDLIQDRTHRANSSPTRLRKIGAWLWLTNAHIAQARLGPALWSLLTEHIMEDTSLAGQTRTWEERESGLRDYREVTEIDWTWKWHLNERLKLADLSFAYVFRGFYEAFVKTFVPLLITNRHCHYIVHRILNSYWSIFIALAQKLLANTIISCNVNLTIMFFRSLSSITFWLWTRKGRRVCTTNKWTASLWKERRGWRYTNLHEIRNYS